MGLTPGVMGAIIYLICLKKSLRMRHRVGLHLGQWYYTSPTQVMTSANNVKYTP